METLLKLMNVPTSAFCAVTKTSDGYYLAQAWGDLGYNQFLGIPSEPHPGPGLTRAIEVWEGISNHERISVMLLAIANRIDLEREFGIPVEKWQQSRREAEKTE